MWYLRTAALADGHWQARNYMTDHFPDGSVVDIADVPPEILSRLGDDTVAWSADADDEGRCRVRVSDWVAPGAPDAWFVLVDGPSSELDEGMVGMSAFATDHLPDGTVIPVASIRDMGVSPREQVAAVKWHRDTGAISNVHTDPAHTRQHLGIKLLHTAGGVVRFNGWSGKLHSDGLRTEAGERFAMSLKLPARVAPWKTVARIEPRSDPSGD